MGLQAKAKREALGTKYIGKHGTKHKVAGRRAKKRRRETATFGVKATGA